MATRPLSPHLSVYRFAYTMALSIFHRATGCALAAGLLVFVAWLMAAAGGAASYERFVDLLSPVLLKVLLGAWVLALAFHFANGIRHLFWDAGYGYERSQARRSALVVVVFAVVVTAALIWSLILPHTVAS